MMRYEANCRWQYDRALRNLLSLRKAAKDQAYDGPIVGPATTVRLIYCPQKGGKCSDGNPHEECPRQERSAAEPVEREPPRTPQPTEPNPTNEHQPGPVVEPRSATEPTARNPRFPPLHVRLEMKHS
jgi:hypothetical protein